MSLSKISGLILGSAALVAGHGYVKQPPEVIAWSEDETDLGFVDGTGYSNANIICHKDAKPGALEASVKAGGEVELQWTDWPSSHHGPVITYLANCHGDCSSVDKTSLEFFKIAESGLINDDNVPGEWASDKLIANNNSATVTIPSSIASGNYVLRHEIIALHSANNLNGAQNYPQCINLKVTGGGSDSPSGVKGTALYKNTDPGISVNIYQSLSTYDIPGPALYTGAASGSGASATSAPASVVATSTAAPTAVSTEGATSTVVDTSYAWTTEQVTVTNTPVLQTQTPKPNEPSLATITETATAAQPTETSSSSSSTGTSSDSGSGSSYDASSWNSYLSTLSADQLLSLVRSTMKWLVTDQKHARDLSK
ncbi:endoglucanase [Penicillium chermesinum]|uniref:Endoglucanase n=1 Tax=Penicillium chermesinum TaxID=63820 RepID=A0A9W9PL15_9EURO|nr:endoglucanase [Penicillium chermesinum]KAJ5247257.1 endoglucanase [Penicillium chermesinum]